MRLFFPAKRDLDEKRHRIILQAIDETDRVRYYSNEKIVSSSLSDVIELVNNVDHSIKMVAFHSYKNDTSASGQSRQDGNMLHLSSGQAQKTATRKQRNR